MTNTIDTTTSHPSGAELKHARQVSRLSVAAAANLCGIHRTTLLRQEAGESRVSLAAYRLLLAAAGFLPGDPAWQGWRMDGAALWSPEGVRFTAGEVRSIPYLHALISELERELRADQQPAKITPLPLPNRGIR